jgi:hypothetical protein
MFRNRRLAGTEQAKDSPATNKPYVAHVMKLANLLANAAGKRAEVAEYLRGIET